MDNIHKQNVSICEAPLPKKKIGRNRDKLNRELIVPGKRINRGIKISWPSKEPEPKKKRKKRRKPPEKVKSQCYWCKKLFSNPINMAKHLSEQICKRDKKVYVCDICNKSFSSRSGFVYHKSQGKKCGSSTVVDHDSTVVGNKEASTSIVENEDSDINIQIIKEVDHTEGPYWQAKDSTTVVNCMETSTSTVDCVEAPTNSIDCLETSAIAGVNSVKASTTDIGKVVAPTTASCDLEVNGLQSTSSFINGLEASSPVVNGLEALSPVVNGLEASSPVVNGLHSTSSVNNSLEASSPVVNGLEAPSTVANGLEAASNVVNGRRAPTTTANCFEADNYNEIEEAVDIDPEYEPRKKKKKRGKKKKKLECPWCKKEFSTNYSKERHIINQYCKKQKKKKELICETCKKVKLTCNQEKLILELAFKSRSGYIYHIFTLKNCDTATIDSVDCVKDSSANVDRNEASSTTVDTEITEEIIPSEDPPSKIRRSVESKQIKSKKIRGKNKNRCPWCKLSFSSEYSLARHLSNKICIRPKKEKNNFVCETCKKSFKSRSGYLYHRDVTKKCAPTTVVNCGEADVKEEIIAESNCDEDPLTIHKPERNVDESVQQEIKQDEDNPTRTVEENLDGSRIVEIDIVEHKIEF